MTVREHIDRRRGRERKEGRKIERIGEENEIEWQKRERNKQETYQRRDEVVTDNQRRIKLSDSSC